MVVYTCKFWPNAVEFWYECILGVGVRILSQIRWLICFSIIVQVVTQWKKDGKKQGLTGLAGRCYNICLVKGEKILDLAAEEKLVIVNKKNYKDFA